MKRRLTNARQDAGNILFLILLAIVLFAALSYAVTQSMRGGGRGAENEKLDLAISEVQNYSASVKTSLQRLTMMKDCKHNQLSFYSPSYKYSANYYAGEAQYGVSGSNSCHVFDTSNSMSTNFVERPKYLEGKVTQSGYEDYVFTGQSAISGVGKACSQIIMLLPVTREMCLRYNEKMGVTNTGGEPPVFAFGNPAQNNQKYGRSGIYTAMCGMSTPTRLGDQGTTDPKALELTGKSTGCYEATSSGTPYNPRVFAVYDVIYEF